MALNPDGTYTYTLNNANPTVQQLAPGETLAETYTYVLTDKDGDTSTATLTITITGAEDLPVATPNTNSVNEGALQVSGNVTRPTARPTPTVTVRRRRTRRR